MRLFWINTYATDRRFGGREEGGWWYDTGEPVASRFAGPFKWLARRMYRAEKLCAKIYNNLHRLHDPSSTLSEGEWRVVYIEHHPPRRFPEARPRYE